MLLLADDTKITWIKMPILESLSQEEIVLNLVGLYVNILYLFSHVWICLHDAWAASFRGIIAVHLCCMRANEQRWLEINLSEVEYTRI